MWEVIDVDTREDSKCITQQRHRLEAKKNIPFVMKTVSYIQIDMN